MDVAEANKLAEENLPLCRFMAKCWVPWGRARGFDYDDLFGIAQLAIVKAGRTYRPDQGSFGHWASLYIRAAYRDAGYRRRPCHLSEVDYRIVATDEPDESPVPLEWSDCWRDLLALLSDRERAVIEMRYFQGLYHRQVGDLLGISRARAHQIEEEAMAKLRELGKQSPQRLKVTHTELAA